MPGLQQCLAEEKRILEKISQIRNTRRRLKSQRNSLQALHHRLERSIRSSDKCTLETVQGQDLQNVADPTSVVQNATVKNGGKDEVVPVELNDATINLEEIDLFIDEAVVDLKRLLVIATEEYDKEKQRCEDMFIDMNGRGGQSL